MRSRWSTELDPCRKNRKTVVREDWSAAVFHFDKKLRELSIVLIWKRKRKTNKIISIRFSLLDSDEHSRAFNCPLDTPDKINDDHKSPLSRTEDSSLTKNRLCIQNSRSIRKKHRFNRPIWALNTTETKNYHVPKAAALWFRTEKMLFELCASTVNMYRFVNFIIMTSYILNVVKWLACHLPYLSFSTFSTTQNTTRKHCKV